jgi:hypothetical protein
VASPLYLHQIQQLPPHAAAAAKKRGNPWPAVEPSENHTPVAAGVAADGGNWNPRMWDWDSRAFTARPSSDALRIAADHHHHPPIPATEAPRQGAAAAGQLSLQLGLREEAASMAMDVSPTTTISSSPSPPARVAAQEQAVRPTKRVRSGSPGTGSAGEGAGTANGGGGGSYPMCQVDECRADLTAAKDYHRRHKVCEAHSKTTKAVVANQMQRFCQQCSR